MGHMFGGGGGGGGGGVNAKYFCQNITTLQ